MSRHALESLHRVAREAGIDHQRVSEEIVADLCKEFHRLRSENIALQQGLERANLRLNILEGSTP